MNSGKINPDSYVILAPYSFSNSKDFQEQSEIWNKSVADIGGMNLKVAIVSVDNKECWRILKVAEREKQALSDGKAVNEK